MKSITLRKPIKVDIDGKKQDLKVINVDLENLTGLDLLDAESNAVARGAVINTASELNKNYLLHIISKASNVGIDSLLELSAKDFTALTIYVQGFLMGDL